jgi:hypothetical protein
MSSHYSFGKVSIISDTISVVISVATKLSLLSLKLDLHKPKIPSLPTPVPPINNYSKFLSPFAIRRTPLLLI